MRRGTWRHLAASGALVTLATSLSACGDPITASRAWNVLALDRSYTSDAIAGAVTAHRVLSGWITDAAGRPLAGTEFREDCSAPVSSGGRLLRPRTAGVATAAYTCTIVLNSGVKVYVAGGAAAQPYAAFAGLGAGGGTLQVDRVRTVDIAAQLPGTGGSSGLVTARDDKGLRQTGHVLRITVRP
jgi:hypothetical protein